MRHPAHAVIADEHHALASMLRSMQMLISEAHRQRKPPPFDVLRAMLLYVDEYPERLHHTKESELLFPKVKQRCPELAPLIERLDADHARGEAAIRELEHTLLAYEVMGESRRETFEAALAAYIEGYLRHMAAEEADIMPAAVRHLTAADWDELNAAFSANRDPLTGHPPEAEYETLFRKITLSAPAPIGLG